MKLSYLYKISIAILLLAILPLPYFYYILLRIFISISAGYFAYRYYKMKKQDLFLAFLAVTLTFNPIFPIYLNKGLWILIDLASVAVYYYAYAKQRLK